MHDRDELCLELGLHVMGDILDGWGDRAPGRERGVHDNAEAFYLEIGLIQGFKGAPIIKVVVKQDGKMGVCDDSGVCLGSQSLARSVGKKRWEVHPGVAMLEGRVLGDKKQEVKIAVLVREGKLIYLQ